MSFGHGLRQCWRLGVALPLALLFLMLSPTSASAQEIVIDVNSLGPSANQQTALDQLDQACAVIQSQGQGEDSRDEAFLRFLCDQLESLNEQDPDDLRQLIAIGDAVAVEEAFAINDTLVIAADYQTTNVRARLDVLRNTTAANTNLLKAESSPVPMGLGNDLAFKEPTGGAASNDFIPPMGFFVNGHTANGEIDGGRLQQSADFGSSSLTLGGDYRFNDNVVAGVGFGLVQDDTRYKSNSGEVISKGFNLTAFASWYESDQGYIDFIIDIGQNDFDMLREVSFDPSNRILARSSTASTSTTISVSGGKSFKPFGWDLGGYFRLSHNRANVDGYEETVEQQSNAFVPVFLIGEQSVVSTQMVMGAELSKPISTRKAVIVPVLRVEYVNENERDKDKIDATLVITETRASYQGERRESGYSNLGLGATAVLKNGRSLFVYYETHIKRDSVSQDWLKIGGRLEF